MGAISQDTTLISSGIIPVDTSAGPVTLTLTSGLLDDGEELIVYDDAGNASGHTITVQSGGGETFQPGAASSLTITVDYAMLRLVPQPATDTWVAVNRRVEASGGVVNFERANGIRYAANFSGSDGGEQIQAALDDLGTTPGTVAVVGGGPDDTSGHSNATRNAAWKLTSAIEVPSATALLFQGAHLFLDDGTNQNIVRNKTAGDGTTDRNSDIFIWADSTSFLNGNGKNQNRPLVSEPQTEPDPMAHFGVFFHKVDRATVGGFRLGRTGGWAAAMQDFNNVRFDSITLTQPGDVHNEDGISFIGPGKDGAATNVTGTTGDDVGTIYTAPTFLQNDLGGYGDVKRVAFRGFSVDDSNPNGPGFRFQTGTTSGGTHTKIRGVTVSDIYTVGGSFQVRNVNSTQSNSDIRGVTLNNAVLDPAGGPLGLFEGRLQDVTIQNVTFISTDESVIWPTVKGASTVDVSIDGLTVENVYSESSKPFFHSSGNTGDITNLTLRNCHHQSVGGGSGSARLLFYSDAGTAKDVTIEDVRLTGSSSSEGMYVRPEQAIDNVQIRNLVVEDVTAAVSIQSTDANTTLPVTVENLTTRNISGARITANPAGVPTVDINPSNTYSPSNDTADRTFDANNTTTAELADVVATLIRDLGVDS